MQRQVRWKSLEGEGTELLTLERDADGLDATGVVVGERGGQPYGLVYRVRLDNAWRTRSVRIDRPDGGPGLALEADGLGHWRRADRDEPLAHLDGCIDVDIAATPFTNSLPIRRLAWMQGDSHDFSMAYVALPDLAVSAVAQRYRCLEARRRFLYEGLFRGFRAELAVDEEGLVLDYPGTFARLP